MLSNLKNGIRNKLSLQDVFEAAVVDRSIQAIVQAHLNANFKAQMAVFTFSEDTQKHSNKTKEVRNTLFSL